MKKILAILLLVCFAGLLTPAYAQSDDPPLKIAIPGREGDIFDYMMALLQLDAHPVAIWDEYDVNEFDGLLLPGGLDIHPSRYGQQDIACGPTDETLDEIQFTAAQRFIEAGKPVFGICRGHQLLNVYFGGTLFQHINNAQAHTKLEYVDNVHASTAAEGSYLHALYGAEFSVNSAHHQAVDTLAEGMQVVQWANDGTVEAMHHTSLPIYSVQWHPERMCFTYAREDTVDGSKVLAFFLNICREHRP